MLCSKSYSQPVVLTAHLAGRSASLEDIEKEIQKGIQSSVERHRERGGLDRLLFEPMGNLEQNRVYRAASGPRIEHKNL